MYAIRSYYADLRAHGLAAGYVALVASSAGFLLNTLLTPWGVYAGVRNNFV